VKRLVLLAGVLALVSLSACKEDGPVATPKPFALNAEAIGHYCGMNVLEHPGPKGQVILASRIDPVWFSSARDTLAFTKLPEEPKDIQAIYVSDMGRAPSWDEPGAENWVDARKAWFVVGGTARSGMGAEETVPFSERAAAERFAADKGGRVVAFADVPADAVLAQSPEAAPAEPAETGAPAPSSHAKP
jgi:copper chaperone NosL